MNQVCAAAMLAQLWTKYYGGDSPSIWEIGSRDGNDALTLTQFFPRSKVWAFEPNPMTFDEVVQNALKEPRIQPVNLALSDVNGTIDFYQIDPTQTITTWEDGNPGASSLFRASGEYLIETYVQRQISVDAARGDTIIRHGEAEPPNLIWMDVQGAEALVLDGLGVALDQVSMIYVELSMREMYSGQALAPEVIDRLQRHGFRWYSVPRTGTWQFDAVFLRTTFRPSLIVRNWFFTLSLRTGIGLGISRTAAGTLQGVTRRARGILRGVLRGISRAVLPILEMIQSRHLDETADRALRVRRPSRTGPAASSVRRIYESSRRIDPLKLAAVELPAIDIVVPCAAKDLVTLYSCVYGARQSLAGQVGKVTVVVSTEVLEEATMLVGGIATVVSETSCGIDSVIACIDKAVPNNRRGWVMQQAIKLGVAAQSTAQGVLVVDADTLLIRVRTWMADGQQVLAVSHSFHLPYTGHAERTLGENGKSQSVSYVTHHQLMQPTVVREMLRAAAGGSNADGFLDRGLVAWILGADYSEGAALSEYHSYGTWIMNTVPCSATLVRWGNVEVASAPLIARSDDEAENLLNILRSEYPRSWSVSFHHYLDTQR